MFAKTYFSFKGKCEAAFEFYKSVFGGEFDPLYRFKDIQEFNQTVTDLPNDGEKIFVMGLSVTANATFNGSDLFGNQDSIVSGDNCCISINPRGEAEAYHIYTSLSEGGKI